MSELPGDDLIRQGIADLERGVESVPALLVSIGAPRLARVGIDVVRPVEEPELRLYAALAAEDSDSAHARCNALIRRLVSFERAAECARQPTRAVCARSCVPSARPPRTTGPRT